MVFLRFPYWAVDGQAFTGRVRGFIPDPMQDMLFKDVWVEPQ
jgi:hypothetical protein